MAAPTFLEDEGDWLVVRKLKTEDVLEIRLAEVGCASTTAPTRSSAARASHAADARADLPARPVARRRSGMVDDRIRIAVGAVRAEPPGLMDGSTRYFP